ncbi:MAG: membrane protein insertion efficiency factor YidD [Bacteroidetes bacterium HGW-Bacteroidetes-12]|nr:MAG: membrane protein insertion efficiency factor YidD [Bacteroidetes bacterium HGW-Bacteroidetes-12]
MVSKIIVFLIRIYQLSISPFLGQNCRYQPTCSQYSVDAVNKYGPLKGGWMALKRISSCHPWGGHGHDPVR